MGFGNDPVTCMGFGNDPVTCMGFVNDPVTCMPRLCTPWCGQQQNIAESEYSKVRT